MAFDEDLGLSFWYLEAIPGVSVLMLAVREH